MVLLYIHIPFCSSKCGYCAFNSFVGQEEHYNDYIKALCVDIEQGLKERHYHIDSIFFGGGTPNLLGAKYYEMIFECVYQNAHIARDCEISLEANINHLNTQWCKQLYALGANRLSVGIQSFEAKKLAFLERDHNARDIHKAMYAAYNAGFSNLSCDLMINTPLDSKTLIESEITQACKLPLKHISVYALSIDSGSLFAQKGYSADSDEELSFYARECLVAQGFSQYEVSNYAKQSYQCRHNLGYWQGEEYLGFGAGAVGRVGNRRLKATPHLKQYIAEPLKRQVEHLDSEALRTEAIMLGLRCKSGVDIKYLDSKSNICLTSQTKSHNEDKAISQGKLVCDSKPLQESKEFIPQILSTSQVCQLFSLGSKAEESLLSTKDFSKESLENQPLCHHEGARSATEEFTPEPLVAHVNSSVVSTPARADKLSYPQGKLFCHSEALAEESLLELPKSATSDLGRDVSHFTNAQHDKLYLQGKPTYNKLLIPLIHGRKCHIRTDGGKLFLCANELFLSDEIALWLLSRLDK